MNREDFTPEQLEEAGKRLAAEIKKSLISPIMWMAGQMQAECIREERADTLGLGPGTLYCIITSLSMLENLYKTAPTEEIKEVLRHFVIEEIFTDKPNED